MTNADTEKEIAQKSPSEEKWKVTGRRVNASGSGKCQWQRKVPVAVESASVAISNLFRDDY